MNVKVGKKLIRLIKVIMLIEVNEASQERLSYCLVMKPELDPFINFFNSINFSTFFSHSCLQYDAPQHKVAV